MGVIKNIIPAIASTNAIVAAACCNEVVKILTGCNYRLKNVSYNFGQTNMNIAQHQDLRKESCIVCSGQAKEFIVKATETLQQSLDRICEEFKLQGPSIGFGNTYLCATGFLAKGIEFKREMTWEALSNEGHFDEAKSYDLIDKSFAG